MIQIPFKHSLDSVGVTEEQFALFGQAMFNLGKVLKCNQSLNFTATEPEDPTDKPDDYILGAMEQYKRVIAQNDSKDPAIKEVSWCLRVLNYFSIQKNELMHFYSRKLPHRRQSDPKFEPMVERIPS